MNTANQTLILAVVILGLIAVAIVAISPLIALGSNQIIFTIVPALEEVSIHAFGY